MPKLRKEKIDEVKKLIEEGFTNTEIYEKTGISHGKIRDLRKNITPINEFKEADKPVSVGLSQESMTKIGFMQGMYGVKTPDEAVDKIYDDIRSLMQLKYRFDADVHKTPSQVLSKVVEDRDYRLISYENILNAKNSTFHQMCLFMIWGIDTAVKALFDMTIPDPNITVFDFMQQAVLGLFKEVGWKIEYYWNDLLEQKQPIITTPGGLKVRFPEVEIEQ